MRAEVASMRDFSSLGDLIDRSRDLHQTAVIDLGGETAPRAFSFDALDRMANGVACGLLARGVARGEQAPAYQHPRFVWCIDALPLSSTNKVDRKQLAAAARTRLETAPATSG